MCVYIHREKVDIVEYLKVKKSERLKVLNPLYKKVDVSDLMESPLSFSPSQLTVQFS